VFYSNGDSYPSGLGRSMVFLLRNVWARMTDEQFSTFLLNKLVYTYLSNEHANPRLMSSKEELLDLFIEYTYTVDMDDDVFITDGGAIPFSDFYSNWTEVLYDYEDDETGEILPKPAPVHDPIIRDTSIQFAMPVAIRPVASVIRDDYAALSVPRYGNVFEALLDIDGERLSEDDRGLSIKALFTCSLDWYAKEHRLNSREFNGKKIIDDLLVKHPDYLSKDCAEQLKKEFYWKIRKPFVLLVAHVERGSYRGSVSKTLGQVGLCMHIASYL
jgi:hypothetical protein